jgi:hypothetical protein
MKFKINHTNATAEGIVFTEPSMTQQHFKDETMIDNILQKYAETGFLTDPFSPKRPIQFGDFSDVTDFQTAQNAVARATESFRPVFAPLSITLHLNFFRRSMILNRGVSLKTLALSLLKKLSLLSLLKNLSPLRRPRLNRLLLTTTGNY